MNESPEQPLSFFERLLWAPVLVAIIAWFTVRGVWLFLFRREPALVAALVAAVQFARAQSVSAPPTKGVRP